jgi:hypothetical protein
MEVLATLRALIFIGLEEEVVEEEENDGLEEEEPEEVILDEEAAGLGWDGASFLAGVFLLFSIMAFCSCCWSAWRRFLFPSDLMVTMCDLEICSREGGWNEGSGRGDVEL